ncbi:MAG: DEAD/DEAH box helicase family protein [Chlorobi bacterium]|nr:DEAD/DEAH box helicase family protein [Chlorobiota bacterium]
MPSNNLLLPSGIRDNRDRGTVGDFLKSKIEEGSALSIVSAYFTIHAFDALKASLNGIEGLRFLFGEPNFIKGLDPDGTGKKAFKIVDEGLQLREQLRQKPVARECADWIREKVQVRSIRESNLLHGKMYHIATNGVEKAIIGSSNFTVRGLGLSPTDNNIELNLVVDSNRDLQDLKAWFDEIWDDEDRVEDVKAEVLATLDRLGKDHAPEFIYYKTLYELFRDDIEARRDSDQKLADTHLYDTKIWNTLYDFQKEGVKSVIARLLRHNGCILADSVGLGKTYTTLAVIKFFESRNERVLVLCPKKLRENWALYPAYNAHRNNLFLDDRFGYTLLSHTDLSRDSGKSGDIDLESFNWRNFDVVVIDESHNFRNDTKPRIDDDGKIRHSRYTRLLEEVIKEGAKTKVLMLSATPVNTSLIDLRNQIYLMTEKRTDVFQKSLGISNIDALLRRAQKAFKAWEESPDDGGRRDKSKLLATLGADFFQLLGGVSIARSRRQIEKFYADEMSRIGEFPKQLKPENFHPPTDSTGTLSYKDLSEQIEKFALSIYKPSSYVIDAEARRRLAQEKQELRFNQEDRERFLIGMMRTNFLKRLESSAYSLAETLGRTIGKIDELLEKIDRFQQNRHMPEAEADILPDDDEDDEEFLVNRGRNPYHLRELDCPRWKDELIKDKLTLTAARDKVKAITPERDGKLEAIKTHIRNKAQNPTTDKDGKTNRKLLVFTTFKDTAVYLYRNLSELAGGLGLNMGLVSGDATQTEFGDNNFNAILTNFAPLARKRDDDTRDEIDLLIATDCISEGQNLQDCDTVLNYDIHWNPVRIIQRFGRIDRIGSHNLSVRMINYWPTEDMDVYLRLRSRVESRMALADAAASGDDDPLNEFTPEQAQMELNFRDQQLKQLREDMLDLDELSDGVVLSDFTLDYFFDQLLRYLERNRAELDATPDGAYAVTDTRNNPAETGVIFFLRQRNASTDKGGKAASPIHPCYAVYIRNNGDIRYGCTNTRQVLDLFEAAAVGKTEPLQKLCIQFDRETQNGADMARYDKLLQAVIAHVSRAHTRTQIKNLGIGGTRDFKLPLESEAPRDASDFELVTWLIIANPQS